MGDDTSSEHVPPVDDQQSAFGPEDFRGPLDIVQTDDGWRIDRPLHYEIGADGSGVFVIVPSGFTADGSSIPRLAWFLMGHPLEGRNGPSGFVHDYLYRCRVITGPNGTRLCSKSEADRIFHEGLLGKSHPLPKWKAWCMWKAVSWFGGWTWRGYRRHEPDCTC